jgi:hypothetical protein
MNHRLVIVEGIMGSGKSTTTRYLGSRLAALNKPVQVFHERSDPHPVRATDDVEHRFKPWLDITAHELSAMVIAKWRRYVEATKDLESISIFDGQLFHGDFTNLFLMEMEQPDLEGHFQQLAVVLKPLNPLVIYFYQEHVPAAIRKIVGERGEEWGKYQTDWKLQGP